MSAEKKQLWSNCPEDRYLLDNIVISGRYGGQIEMKKIRPIQKLTDKLKI